MNGVYYPNYGILPYESAISIILKASRLNFIELERLAVLIADPKSPLCTGNPLFNKNIPESLGATELNLIENYISPVFMRDVKVEFFFCIECSKVNYHSVFNLMNYHSVCSLHKCALRRACVHCIKYFMQGFVSITSILSVSSQCRDCGFSIPEAAREIRMCQNHSMLKAMSRQGHNLAQWYHAINSLAMQADEIALEYYSSENSRALFTELLEQKLCLPSPERLANQLKSQNRVYWLHQPAYISERDGINFVVRQQTLDEACRAIETKYLSTHYACMQAIDALTSPYLEEPCIYSFCSVSLAYALLRIKLESGTWPTSDPSSSFWSSGFFNFKHVASPLGRNSNLQELTLMFLHILGELQFMISKRRNFLVVCGDVKSLSPRLNQMVYVRRTTPSFRSICKSEEIDIKISRLMLRGPLLVTLNSDEFVCRTMSNSDILII